MEFVRNRLKTLHIIMLALIGLFAIAAAIYFTRADNGVYDASDVLGQYDPPATTYPPLYTNGDPWNGNGLVSNEGFSGNGQMAIDPTTMMLFVADTASNRVLGYLLSADGTLSDMTADIVLGQFNMDTSSPGISDYEMSGPEGVAIDLINRQLFVADTGNNRVIVYNIELGVSTAMPAHYIIGQPTTGDNTAGTSNALLNQPTGLDYDHVSNILYIADTGNNRIVVTDGDQGFQTGLPTGTDGLPFSFVIGQTDFVTATSGLSAEKFSAPQGVDVNINGDILVTDTGNNRVLSFNGNIAANGNSATRVIGQIDLTFGTSGLTDSTLSAPTSAVWDDSRSLVYVADTGNNRVLTYDVTGGIVDGMAASYVIGQSDFTSGSAAVAQDRISSPASVVAVDIIDQVGGSQFDAGVREYVWVSDTGNNRVLTFDYVAPSDPSADVAVDVIGHFSTVISDIGTTPRYTTSASRSGLVVDNNRTFSGPQETVVDTKNHRLYVIDRADNNRIMVFNLDSSNNLIDRIADNVIGQPDFVTRSMAIATQSHLANIMGMALDSDNDILFVGDRYRILAFDVRSIGSAAKTMCGYISYGLANEMNASCVFGQHDLVTYDPSVLPATIAINQVNELAYDRINKRLYFVEFQSRVKYIDLSSGIANALPTERFVGPFTYEITDIAVDSAGERLFVASDRAVDEFGTYGGVIRVFDIHAPVENQAPVHFLGTADIEQDFMLDQDQCAEFLGNASYDEHWTASAICDMPLSMAYDDTNDLLYVSARGFTQATRVLVFDVATIVDNENAVAVLGQQDFTSEVVGGVTQSSFNLSTTGENSTGLSVDGVNNRLYFAGDNRVLVFDFIRPVAQSLPAGTAGTPYGSVSFSTENAQGDSSLIAVSGIPAGMTFDTNTLALSGTPAVAGTYDIVLRAVDEFGASTFYGNRTYTLSIAGGSGGGGGDPIDSCTDPLANNFNQQNTCEYDAPEVSIAAPVSVISPATSATYTSSVNSIVVSGTATDRDTVTSVMYSLNGSTPVAAIGIASWTTSNLMLVPGPNTFTVTAINNHGLQSLKSLTIMYGTTPPPNCTTNPSLPGCNPVDPPNCTNTPSLPGCNPVDPPNCTTNPTLPGCIATPNCTNTPSLPGCNPVNPPETCATNPSLPSCVSVDPGGPVITTDPGAVSTEDISTYAMVASRIGLILGMIAAIFAGSVAISELAFLPQRIWQMILGAIGFKKRTRRWGTVYDSVTKQPLDPVYVTLTTSAGKEVATSITDIDGRFGFLVEPGAYRIWVNKTNYLFPSRKLAGRDYDEIYKDLYFGEEFVVAEKEDVFAKNIPMDPVLFNWNEYVKHEQKLTRWNAKRDKIVNRIANTIFVIGFISSVIAAIIIPTTFNLILVGVYIVLLLVRELGIKAYRSGFVEDKAGKPLAYGLVHIYSASLGKKLFTRPLDKYGRYFALVPKGDYYVTIDTKNEDQSYTEVFKSKSFTTRRGVINKKFIIS